MLHRWRQRNFPGADATQQLLGVVEEVGELSHAVLKRIQHIRGNSELHEAEAYDAIGDILIYLAGFCSYKGWDMMSIYEDTAKMVMARDWIADPVGGSSESKGV
jgi:NTP pyrophosphatase (non-canonical NTP hydrolase)